jgi:enoyl-CoA hydratase/carnithine racemase
MTCDRFTAEQAAAWGFVNRVVPEGEAVAAARELARQLLAKDPVALAVTKSTCSALAEAMVPAHVTHADPDYLVLARLLAQERGGRSTGG